MKNKLHISRFKIPVFISMFPLLVTITGFSQALGDMNESGEVDIITSG